MSSRTINDLARLEISSMNQSLSRTPAGVVARFLQGAGGSVPDSES
ncbi:hypothetical protein WCP94_002977 [Bilophila wadsworthia]